MKHTKDIGYCAKAILMRNKHWYTMHQQVLQQEH